MVLLVGSAGSRRGRDEEKLTSLTCRRGYSGEVRQFSPAGRPAVTTRRDDMKLQLTVIAPTSVQPLTDSMRTSASVAG